VSLALVSASLSCETKACFLSRVIAIKVLSLIDILFDRIVNVLVMRVSRQIKKSLILALPKTYMNVFVYILGSELSISTATVSGNVYTSLYIVAVKKSILHRENTYSLQTI
jgi:hypothetical protein